MRSLKRRSDASGVRSSCAAVAAKRARSVASRSTRDSVQITPATTSSSTAATAPNVRVKRSRSTFWAAGGGCGSRARQPVPSIGVPPGDALTTVPSTTPPSTIGVSTPCTSGPSGVCTARNATSVGLPPMGSVRHSNGVVRMSTSLAVLRGTAGAGAFCLSCV
jgi:hypothetical protein